MLQRRILIPLFALLLVLTACGDQPERVEVKSAPTTVRTVILNETNMLLLAKERANLERWYFVASVNRYADALAANEARERAEAEAHAREKTRASAGTSRTSASAPSSSGHDPCAEPMNGLLPDYIVQRESGGQCDAYNHGGCGGRGCLGWAQIDEGHFWADSPWGSGPGSCYGLSYNGCVNRLSNGGSNLDPWKCC